MGTSRLGAASDCWSEDQLLDLAEGRRSISEPAVVQHLDECSGCREILAALVPGASTETAPPPVPVVGGRVGRYEILEVVGAGATGLVYAAQDPALGRKVALKLLRSVEGAHGPELRLRLIREAQALARLSHPHVVSVHEVGTLGALAGQMYLAMDLVEGGTLADWLAERPRSGAEIIPVFVMAGEGLAAAHAVGLVHRDFKPDNVLVGKRGEVRVTDFGLARWTELHAPVPGPAPPGAERLDLTRTGTLLGTPAFMSPEQLAGGIADARSDQFSFCVSLYQALYGPRPFTGSSAEELRQAIESQALQRPTLRARVPARVRRALLRGLQADPSHRFPSMELLLAELRRRPPSLLGVAVATALVVGGAGVAVERGRARATLCSTEQSAWGDVWSAAQQARVQASFAAAGERGPVAYGQVDGALQAQRSRWVRMRTDACEATQVRHEQSEALLDLRMACLDDRRRRVEQVANLFEQADADLVTRAVAAVQQLPALDDCAHASSLLAIEPLPAAPAARATIARLSEASAKAGAQWLTGRYEQGLQIVRPAVAEAEALGYRPVWGQLLYQEAALVERTSESDRAERLFWATVPIATQAGDDGTAADTWVWLGAFASRHHQWEQAHSFFQLARAHLARLGGDDLREVDVLRTESYMAGDQGLFEEEEAKSRQSLELLSRAGRSDDWRAAEALDGLASAHEGEGRNEEALGELQKTVALREKVFGPTARDIGGALLDLAEVERRLGRTADALAHALRAMAIRKSGAGRHLDPDGESQLALAYRAAGQPAEALTHDRQSVTDAMAEGDAQGWRTSWGLLGEGQDLVALGRAGEAVTPLERAAALRARDEPPDAEAPWGLAQALWQSGGDRQRARALATQAAAALEPRAAKYGSFYAAQRTAITAWLDAHPAPATDPATPAGDRGHR